MLPGETEGLDLRTSQETGVSPKTLEGRTSRQAAAAPLTYLGRNAATHDTVQLETPSTILPLPSQQRSDSVVTDASPIVPDIALPPPTKEAAEKLISYVDELNERDTYGMTPLCRAARDGREDDVKLLLATGQVDLDLNDFEFG